MSIVQMASASFLNDSVDNIEFGSSGMNSEVPHWLLHFVQFGFHLGKCT